MKSSGCPRTAVSWANRLIWTLSFGSMSGAAASAIRRCIRLLIRVKDGKEPSISPVADYLLGSVSAGLNAYAPAFSHKRLGAPQRSLGNVRGPGNLGQWPGNSQEEFGRAGAIIGRSRGVGQSRSSSTGSPTKTLLRWRRP